MLTSLTLNVFLATCPVACPSEGVTDDSSLLSLVPEESFVIARCDDFASLRSRAERNDWVEFLGSSRGEVLLHDSAREFEVQTGTDLDELLGIANQLHGESVFFSTREVAGFVTVAPLNPASLLETMRTWLPTSGPEAVTQRLEIAGAKVEVTAWPEVKGSSDRQGHFAALVEHPGVLGLFSGDDLESLSRVLEQSLGGFGGDRRAPVVEGLESARRTATSRGAVEFYMDFSPFVAEAERELARSIDGYFPDPSGMLGIDQGLWLYTVADVHPGTRFEGSGFLNVPVGTLAAKLADCFGSLPTDLPTKLPSGITNLFALDWDLYGFYTIVREAFVERHGDESLETLDQSLSAAESMSGLDPIEQVLSKLGSQLVLYFRPSGDSRETFDFRDMGFLLSLVDGDAFLDAFEQVVGGGPLEEYFDADEIEGAEAYMWDEGESRGGMAFLPRYFLMGGSTETLTQGVRALVGVSETTLLDGSEVQLAYDRRQGACYFACQRLVDLPGAESLSVVSDGESKESAERRLRLFESLLVSSAHREKQGFRFEVRAR